MPPESNKAIVRCLFDEIFNHRNLAVADALVAPNYVNHNAASIEVLGPEGVKRAAAAQFAAFPSLHTALEDIIAEGDKVVVRGTDRFIHQPDGQQVTLTWIEINRVENGKAAEAWVEMDTKRLEQLGVVPIRAKWGSKAKIIGDATRERTGSPQSPFCILRPNSRD